MPFHVIPEQTQVSVVGLGYVGLPTALSFHSAGFIVRGVDVSERVISCLNEGVPPFVDEGVDLQIPSQSSRWQVTNDFSIAIPDSDIVLITVPTPVSSDKKPDLSYVISASKSVLREINRDKNTIVVLESTVYPGVTRTELGRLCRELNLTPGEDIFLAYSPERINPGDPMHSANSVDRIVGCDDSEIGHYLAEVYSRITSASSTYVGKIEVAEAAKLVENVQRDIDIAFVNELSSVFPRMGVDVEEVLSAASTKWNFHRHTPGIGVGGHCIPVDPYYYSSLSNQLGFPSLISPIARKINENMPMHASTSIMNLIQGVESPRALVLGYSYKPETGDTRMTPVEEMIQHLESNGCSTLIWDPFVLEGEFSDEDNFATVFPKDDHFDIVVLATAHRQFLEMDWADISKICPSKVIFDGRRVLSPEEMKSIGWNYHGIGFPT